MNDVSKEFVKNALAKGDYSLYSKSGAYTAEWWSTLIRFVIKEIQWLLFSVVVDCLYSRMIQEKSAHHHSVLM